MSSETDDSPAIETVLPEARGEALGLLLSHLAPSDAAGQVRTLLSAAKNGEISLDGLLCTHSEGKLSGVVLTQVQPGCTAALWPPRTTADEPQAVTQRLIEAACDFLVEKGVRTVQALLGRSGGEDDALLRSAGFKRLADLLYMVSTQDTFPKRPPQTPLQFEPYRLEQHQRLAAIVEATYQETLDCPELDGARPIDEVLEGYRETGVFDPDRWLIVRHDGEDIGCLLLADHPTHDNWELVYMGLTVATRGKAWGQPIAAHAQWLTHLAGRSRLVVAVDAANHPAVKMYAAVGFETWERCTVYVKVFSVDDCAP
jgi:mycothiol synthase